MADRREGRWRDAVAEVIRESQLCQPDELPAVVNSATRGLGIDLTMYLVDLEQRELRPLPERGKPVPPSLSVDGTVAGRAFAQVRTTRSGGSAGEPARLWVPLVDGTERLGVVEMCLREGAEDAGAQLEQCELLAGLMGHLIAGKLPYGDVLHQVRRTGPVSPAAELLMKLVPPLTFSCDRMVISALLEPCYEVGGDAFDYAVDGPIARMAILDAMGRGMRAGLTCAIALAATRAARRDGQGLYAMARAADQAIIGQFKDVRFVTALLAELDLDTGQLRYVNAGHPPGLVLRRGKVVRTLGSGRRMPLGVDDPSINVAEERLEPGDNLLLYTDGITEARAPDGDLFGVDRLVDLTERHAVEGLPAPEKLRRLAHSVVAHQAGSVKDDATLMLLEWSTTAALRGVSMTALRERHR
jgi:hypothetical protein